MRSSSAVVVLAVVELVMLVRHTLGSTDDLTVARDDTLAKSLWLCTRRRNHLNRFHN
jgi:hypothetical protein